MPARFKGNHEKAATNRESAFDRKLQQFRITGEIQTSAAKQSEVKRKLTDDYEYKSMDSRATADLEISELERLAFTDPLTDCENQRTINNHFKEEVKRAHRYRQALGVMVMEIDEFEKLTSELPQFAIENLLRAIASMLKKNIREVDLIGRVSGGRFMLVCPETSIGQICVMAERLRNMFACTRIASIGYNLNITVSAGISSFPQTGENAPEVLSAAEEALSMAMEKGGNFISEPQSTRFVVPGLLTSFFPGMAGESQSFKPETEDFSPTDDQREQSALLAAIEEPLKPTVKPVVARPVVRPAVAPELKV